MDDRNRSQRETAASNIAAACFRRMEKGRFGGVEQRRDVVAKLGVEQRSHWRLKVGHACNLVE